MCEQGDMDRKALGRLGEQAAAQQAVEDGWEIIERNYRFKGDAEVDLICRRKDLLVFVEVRTVSTDYLDSPALTVDKRKQGQVIRAARLYLKEKEMSGIFVRFDVAAVTLDGEGSTNVEWYEDAFRPPSTALNNRLI